jgi:hypothetical protein
MFSLIIVSSLSFRIPESPRWLIMHGKKDEALKVFMQVIFIGSFTLAKFVKQNCWQQRHMTVTTVLALATLGRATKIEWWPRQVQ